MSSNSAMVIWGGLITGASSIVLGAAGLTNV